MAVNLSRHGTTACRLLRRSWSTGFRLHLCPIRNVSSRIKVLGAVTQQTEARDTAAAEDAAGELPKNFNPSAAEERIYRWWEESGFFKPSDSATGPPFTIPMPPPNVTGKLHMGHAMFVTLEDIMARYARMAGRRVLWLPGTDHAGIATQSVVEKRLLAEGVKRLEIGREEFEQRVWAWKQMYGGFITGQLRRLGASCDWSRERFTLDAQLSEAVVEAFCRLHEKGLIVKGSYMVNWSPLLRTAVSDLEVEYSQEPGKLYYFKYPVAGTAGEFLPVATTRPETIPGDTAVAVNPNDPRFQKYIGMSCIVPTSGRVIPIVADEYVDMEFGTGALKITPGHDVNDYEIGKRLCLQVINIMNKDATLNAAAGKYAGLDRSDARLEVWKDLEAAGLALKVEPHELRVPRSQRGGEVVEPLVSEQWFVRMEGLAQPALQALTDGTLCIMPKRYERTYSFWLENIKDWCVSRQLWWGHRIPAWYVFDSQEAADAALDGRSERFVVARNQQDALRQAQEKYGQDVVLRQEEDVLDTWFSSGLWPFSTLGWPNTQAADYQTFYPTQVLETGHDILFFWVARMIMMGIEFTGQPPFHMVYLHGLVRDDKGRKMSKSLGNVLDPLDIISDSGTDALRYTLVTGNTVGQDLNLSLDRVSASRNFTNKLWNAGRFILFNLQGLGPKERASLAEADFSSTAALPELPLTERWIISSLHQVVDASTAAQEKFDFGEAGRLLYEFFWGEFADWFVEASKERIYGGDPAAVSRTRQVLVYVFDRILRLAHPFMPFITEELWQALPHKGESLMLAAWPAAGAAVDATALRHFSTLKGIVRSIRNLKAEYNVPPGNKIAATILVADAVAREAIDSERLVIALLARLDPVGSTVVEGTAAAASGDAGQQTVALVVEEGVEVQVPMAGLVDVGKEVARLGKQKAKIEKDLLAVMGRLNNPNFMSRASAAVVAEAQQQAAEAREKLAAVEEKLQQVEKLQ